MNVIFASSMAPTASMTVADGHRDAICNDRTTSYGGTQTQPKPSPISCSTLLFLCAGNKFVPSSRRDDAAPAAAAADSGGWKRQEPAPETRPSSGAGGGAWRPSRDRNDAPQRPAGPAGSPRQLLYSTCLYPLLESGSSKVAGISWFKMAAHNWHAFVPIGGYPAGSPCPRQLRKACLLLLSALVQLPAGSNSQHEGFNRCLLDASAAGLGGAVVRLLSAQKLLLS